MSTAVSDEILTEEIKLIVQGAGAEPLSAKGLREKLEEKFGIDLKDRKDFLREQVAALSGDGDGDPTDSGNAEGAPLSDEEDGDKYSAIKNRTRSGGRAKAAPKRKNRPPGVPEGSDSPSKKRTGKKTAVVLSPALVEFLGNDGLSKGEVTKAVWAYIKANNLQDPNNGRKINCDEKLTALLKCKSTTMFKLAQRLAKHMKDAALVC